MSTQFNPISAFSQQEQNPYLLILNFIYKNEKNDYFHEQISSIIKSVKIQEAGQLPKEKIVQSLTDPSMKWTLPSIVKNLLSFQKEFPSLFEKLGYQEDLDYIQKELCDRYGIASLKNFVDPISEEYSIKEEAKNFRGDLLIFGCGPGITGHCGPHDFEMTFFISNQENYKPHILGDYYSHEFWKELPDNTFKEAFFEGFNPNPCSSSLKETHRILKVGGKVRIYFDGAFEIAHQEGHLEDYLKSCGFKKMELVKECFFSCGETAEHNMIHAYK